MKRVEIRLEDDVAAFLDHQANALGISRCELVRNRATNFSYDKGKKFTPVDFYNLVNRTRRRAGAGVDKRQLEGIVAFVFNELVG